MTAILRDVSLADRFEASEGTVLLSGIHALVRAMLEQRRRDAAAGLNTAGFACGYRGSPIGGLDREFERQETLLTEHHIRFQPGVNEELAAMAVWGSQQVNLYEGGRYDGVFGLWYGKGAGVDRSIDVLRHANAAGSAPFSGALAVMGDDHLAKSSSQPHNCEVTCTDLQMPLLFPASVPEVVEYALAGWAMSRHSACWTALKILPEIADATATFDLARLPHFVTPPAPEGIHIRTPDPFLEQETRLVRVKIDAARAFARANGLDKTIFKAARPRFGIMASGKAYLDVFEALRLLGLSPGDAAELGLSLYKVAMPFPLEPEGAAGFAAGHERLLVVEEKRPVIEQQLKDLLYNRPAGERPQIVGKQDTDGSILVPRDGETTPQLLAAIIGRGLLDTPAAERIRARLERLSEPQAPQAPAPVSRIPFYCPGCPHNTSTQVPDGSRVIAGIGCHSLAQWMDRRTDGLTVMGGEGSSWVGQTPFTDQKHVFTNMGDGTYFHSGIMPIRAAIAARTNITFKVLFNDAVAMTGGQSFDGPLSVPMITRQVDAEGASAIVVVTDEPERYTSREGLAPQTRVEHRDDLERVQKELRETEGVSILIYDQTCAAEKRRRRKRGTMEDPDLRVVINERVCEGCGDCSVKSNCIAVEPVQTPFGRKRRINQSACNKDYSCLKGFCPSFVTVAGGNLAANVPDRAPPEVPAAEVMTVEAPRRVLISGIGGTGVVTASALLAMAAHLEGKAASALDLTGMAQKGGAVSSHITVARNAEEIGAARIPAAGADLVIAADMVFTAAPEMLSRIQANHSAIVLNADIAPVGEFTRNPLLDFQEPMLRSRIERAAGGTQAIREIAAAELSTRLMGDAIATNMLMLGYACQQGLLPVGAAAMERAIELNGTAVAMNKRAFAWGRALAADPGLASSILNSASQETPRSLDDYVEMGVAELTAYQNRAYGARYRRLVEKAREAEARLAPGRSGLAEAVARSALKAMAYKDEYEVARLYTDGAFARDLRAQLGETKSMRILMSPPILARTDPATGLPRKMSFGGWILPVLSTMARMKWLRGTPLDPFGRTEERRAERRLVEDFEQDVGEIADRLTPQNHALAVDLAGLPQEIRGFGPIKAAAMEKAAARRAGLLERLRAGEPELQAAE
ncbi:indolepyruvate ferredoxin oxidoreductase family protein [Afifella sp. IM 167]|uniref:indolepyruvate ferredoxin oxidoreductase family protein n=1 Tax=Afifella sp. IM 167 TaxID=2033586 RepID=UPI001CCB4CBB|nr:indolepyruvate ferredoxin oxidoreductase family protein [Afifella sp. IM 167]MBZ8134785.1 indolepyruvate ferredoxin oxidoreductase [Afifella sp. IM 167]